MGCDIHFFVERYTSDNNFDGPKDIQEERHIKLSEFKSNSKIKRWVSADKWGIEEDYWYVDDEYYSGRNYYLFGILANVRNNSIKPIDDPRGIPNDASIGYKRAADQMGSDAHSHSYFSLSELLDVNWNQYDENLISEFLNTIERMKKIDQDPENVRCCFFFDN